MSENKNVSGKNERWEGKRLTAREFKAEKGRLAEAEIEGERQRERDMPPHW